MRRLIRFKGRHIKTCHIYKLAKHSIFAQSQIAWFRLRPKSHRQIRHLSKGAESSSDKLLRKLLRTVPLTKLNWLRKIPVDDWDLQTRGKIRFLFVDALWRKEKTFCGVNDLSEQFMSVCSSMNVKDGENVQFSGKRKCTSKINLI